MSDEYMDPSGNTAQFKAFATEPDQGAGASRTGLIVAGGVLALAVLALIVWAVL